MKTITLDWVTYNLTPVNNDDDYIIITWWSWKEYKVSQSQISDNPEFDDDKFFTHKQAVKQFGDKLPNISEFNDMIEWNLYDKIWNYFPGSYYTDGSGPHNSGQYAYYWTSDTDGGYAWRLYLNSSEGSNLNTNDKTNGFQVKILKR